jgi:hypothetical protein
MEELVKKLIIRICQKAYETRVPVCVTRATKLMYLIEWEYFAWQRNRLTSLDWIYLHYGPWSSKLSGVLQSEFKAPPEEEQEGRFRQVFWTPPEFSFTDTHLNYELEGIVQRVLDTFGALPTSEIIRYVYFNTEPMQNAERGKPLDFAKTKKPIKPFNSVVAVDKSIRKEIRERLRLATQAKLASKWKVLGDVPSDIIIMLAKLDSSGDFSLPEGEILITPQDKLEIAEEG